MPRSKSARRDSTRSSARTELTEFEAVEFEKSATKAKRTATLYDAVAGRVGGNGFLTLEQLESAAILPLLPGEVLLRRVGAPDEIPYDFYNADENLAIDQRLPDSDLLKAIHAYTSDFFASTSTANGQKDFRSFDGTALMALGILLEEASKEALGENGDMALTESEVMDGGPLESQKIQYQIIGAVNTRKVQQPASESEQSENELEQEESPRKRRRARR